MKYTQQQFDTALDAYKRVDLTMSERKDLKARVLAQVAPQVNMYRHTTAIKRVVGFGGLLFLSSATLAFGSQYSEPGDILYGLETEIVEPMIGAVIFDDQEYKEYQTKLAMERIDEVLGLDSSDPTHTQHVAQARDLFDQHIATASEYTEGEFESKESQEETANATMAMRIGITTDNDITAPLIVNELEMLFALAVAVNQDNTYEEIDSTDDLRNLAYELDIQSQVQYAQEDHENLYASVAEILEESQHVGDSSNAIFTDTQEYPVGVATLKLASDDADIQAMSISSSTVDEEEHEEIQVDSGADTQVSVPEIIEEKIQVLPRNK